MRLSPRIPCLCTPSPLHLSTTKPMLLMVLCFGNGLLGVVLAATPAKQAEDLPPEGIYPQGRKLAFAGYSGDPARDLANGFTVAGPVYGNQQPYLDRCFANGWPVIVHVGPRITFNDKDPAKYKLDATSLRQEVEQHVKELAAHKQVAWWAIRPEKLRPWWKAEMQYLDIVCETWLFNQKVQVDSTPTMRAAYLRWLLAESNRLNARLVTWFFPENINCYRKNEMKRAPEAAGIATMAMNLGLYEQGSRPRPALDEWKEWRKKRPAQRP